MFMDFAGNSLFHPTYALNFAFSPVVRIRIRSDHCRELNALPKHHVFRGYYI